MHVNEFRSMFQILTSSVLTKRRIISQHVKGVWNNTGLWFDFWQPQNRAGGQNQKSQKFVLNIIPLKTGFVQIHSNDSLSAVSYRVD